MKVTDRVQDLTPEEQAVQGLFFTLVTASNPTRASGKSEKDKKKRKGRGKKKA
jgi:hypothetical protein